MSGGRNGDGEMPAVMGMGGKHESKYWDLF